MHRVDVIVVSYNSAVHLRRCIEPLASVPATQLFVADNAPGDGSWETVADLGATRVLPGGNVGFGRGCNAAAAEGDGDYLLFVNPDAVVTAGALRQMVAVLDGCPRVGVVGPRIEDDEGNLHFSQRWFPSLRRTFATAFFLHHVFPKAAWSDEVIRDPARYSASGSAEWLSGACLLIRRGVFEQVGGFDARFFLYCEDMDLCRRIHDAGYEVRFTAEATVTHLGGASSPLSRTLALLARSRITYAQKHFDPVTVVLDRIGLFLTELVRVALSRGGAAVRRGHARALAQIVGISPSRAA